MSIASGDLPVMQMIVPGDPPYVIATYAPGGRFAAWTGRLVEASRVRAIPREQIERLAAILDVEPDLAFVFDMNDSVVGYASLIAFDFRSPRFFRDFFHALEANPEATIQKYRDDPFVSYVVEMMRREVLHSLASPFDEFAVRFRELARWAYTEFRRLVPRGPKADRSSLFYQHLVKRARRLGCGCALPARDPSRGGPRSTPLLEFADLMRALLLDQAAALGVSEIDTQFAKLRVSRLGLIMALERAKAIVTAEKPIITQGVRIIRKIAAELHGVTPGAMCEDYLGTNARCHMPDTPPDHPLYGYRIVGGMFERLLGCSVYFRLATPEEAALIAQRPRPTANILDVLDQRKRPPRLRAGRATGRRRNRPGLQRSRGHAPKTSVRRSGLTAPYSATTSSLPGANIPASPTVYATSSPSCSTGHVANYLPARVTRRSTVGATRSGSSMNPRRRRPPPDNLFNKAPAAGGSQPIRQRAQSPKRRPTHGR